MDKSALKAELREQARLHRNQIIPTVEDAESICALFKEHVVLPDGHIVAAYWPMGKECDVRYIIDDLIKARVKVALPVTSPDKRTLDFRLWDGKAELVKGPYGILMPGEGAFVKPDIFLIPLLAFDRQGYRLGQGQGHYDATIAAARTEKSILAVGVGYSTQAVLFHLPVEPHDQKLDLVITPMAVHDFR